MKRIRDEKLRKYAKDNPTAHGGSLRRTRYGRMGGRPLCTRDSIHLTLRSTMACGPWSFKAQNHAAKIEALVRKFALKYGVQVFHCANVRNHLHLHIQLKKLANYPAFVRSLTGAIAMAVTGAGKGRPLCRRFWDQRPFTRLVQGVRQRLRLKDYIAVNQLEGEGIKRELARKLVSWRFRAVRV